MLSTLKRSASTESEGIVNKKRKQNNVEFHPLEETIQTQKKFRGNSQKIIFAHIKRQIITHRERVTLLR